MISHFTLEERRDRARAYGMVLHNRLTVVRASRRRGKPARPPDLATAGRAALRVETIRTAIDRALIAKVVNPVRLEWLRAELDIARTLLEIEAEATQPCTAAVKAA